MKLPKIPGWGTAIGAIASVIDKLVPGRKEKLDKEITALEGELKKALNSNNDMRAAKIRVRLRQLRKRIGKMK